MKHLFRNIMIIAVLAIAPCFAVLNTGMAFAEGEQTASVLKDCGSKASGENGEGIFCLLNTAVDILSVGVGVLGVLGITIVGIQYLTAGGSEDQTRKAKRRMYEIVIGLVVYVLIAVILKWLLPSMNANS